MTGFRRNQICAVSVFALLLAALFSSPVQAHPDAGLMPDSVAEMEYKVVLEINPQDINTRNKLGMVFYRKNKLREAEKEFATVLKQAPRDFDAHDGMGLVKIKEQRYNEAIGWFDKAIALNPKDTMVHCNRGFALEQAGKPADAEIAYRKGLEVNAELIRQGVNRDAENRKRETLLQAHKAVQQKLKGAPAKK